MQSPMSIAAKSMHPSRSFLARSLRLRLLQHLLYDFLLLDQESSHDPVPHAVAAPRSAVCSGDVLLRLGGCGVFAGSEGWDLLVENFAQYTLRW
jgi:hypothetical protein